MYPFGVYFPSLTGELYLLGWNTHDTQDNIIVAKSKEAAFKTFDSLLKKENVDKVNYLLRVEVIASPERYEEEYAKQHQRDISHFWQWIIGNLSLRGKRNLPGFITRCPHCIKKPVYSRGCEVCCEGFVPTQGTLEYVYLNKCDMFKKELTQHVSPTAKKKQPSKAPVYFGDEKVYYVEFSFGHHCGGVGYNDVDYERVEPDVGFFFLKKEELDVERDTLRHKLETFTKNKHDQNLKCFSLNTQRRRSEEKARQERIVSIMSAPC